MSSIAAEISGICAKDLISSEARYHSSCYNAFVRIVYETDAAAKSSTEPSSNNYGIEEVYEAVFSFCETLISNPRVLEFKGELKVRRSLFCVSYYCRNITSFILFHLENSKKGMSAAML